MAVISISISELRSKSRKSVDDLEKFMEMKTDAMVSSTNDEITLEYEEINRPSKSHIRVLIKKFLHKADLRDEFRVISGKEDVFIIKERK